MSMGIKLIATDLDGTLLMPDHVTVSDENIAALKTAAENGIRIVIASGRTLEVFPSGIKKLKFLSWALMSNGASMIAFDYPGTGEAMTHSPITELPYDIWEPVYRKMIKAGTDPEIYALGKSFMDRSRSDRYASSLIPEALVEELKSHIDFVDDVTDILRGRGIEKICALTIPEESRASLTRELQEDGNLEITSSIPGNIEVNMKGTSKGRALAMLCEMLNILPEEVMALGDAGNDIEMLKFAGCSVAMGNGTNEAKSVSSYVTASNAENGVAQAIMKYIY